MSFNWKKKRNKYIQLAFTFTYYLLQSRLSVCVKMLYLILPLQHLPVGAIRNVRFLRSFAYTGPGLAHIPFFKQGAHNRTMQPVNSMAYIIISA